MRHLPANTDLSVMGVRVGRGKFIFGSIDRYNENITFQLKFLFFIKTVGVTVLGGLIKTLGATVLGGLGALKWAWQTFFWVYR